MARTLAVVPPAELPPLAPVAATTAGTAVRPLKSPVVVQPFPVGEADDEVTMAGGCEAVGGWALAMSPAKAAEATEATEAAVAVGVPGGGWWYEYG